MEVLHTVCGPGAAAANVVGCGDSGAQTTHREATRGGKGHNGIEHIQDMADGRWQMGRRGVERTQDPTVARETNAATQKAQEQEKRADTVTSGREDRK